MANLKPKSEYQVMFDRFDGGMNLRDTDYDMAPNESPEMRNLVWRNGMLASRKGMRYVSSASIGQGYAMYEHLWHGYAICHIFTRLYAFKVSDGTYSIIGYNVPRIRGTFFMYDGNLYYKTNGAYKKISATYDSVNHVWTFSSSDVAAYTPVIVINAAPASGSGNIYQPENRYSALKTVWYNAESGVTEYVLPVAPDTITRVEVDGVVMTTGWGYYAANHSVIFTVAPPVTNPPTNNTVRITYSKANTAAFNSIDECRYACCCGGTGELCVVMAGCSAQPNAYFWSGNSSVAMDPGYFPMEQYQLSSSFDDAIMGFGKQQNNLVVFKQLSIGKALLGIQEINGRNYIDLPYTPINAEIGCGYPWSIQLVNNNLVWANDNGVYMLTDTTEAGENDVVLLSEKINGTPPGRSAPDLKRALLYDLSVTDADSVCSADDGHSYYIMCNGYGYAWNYEISGGGLGSGGGSGSGGSGRSRSGGAGFNPAWFYLTNMYHVALAVDGNDIYMLDSTGALKGQQETFADFGLAIDRFYRFPTQKFEGYDTKKNVNSVIVALGADYPSNTVLSYITDNEPNGRDDLTNLKVIPPSTYESTRPVGSRPERTIMPAVFRRRPMCRRVSVFTMTLYNRNVNEDLALVSAQILFENMGRLR